MDEVFEKYEKRAVAAGLNKYKTQQGAHVRVNEGKPAVHPLVTLSLVLVLMLAWLCHLPLTEAVKEKLAEGIAKLKMGGDDGLLDKKPAALAKPKPTSGPTRAVDALVAQEQAFMPIHWQAKWTPHDRQERVGIVHSLPSGIIDGGDIFPSIVDDGLTYQCRVRVNQTLTDPMHFLVGFIKSGMQMDHPRMIAFVNELAAYRAKSSDEVWATCSIPIRDGLAVREEIAASSVCNVNGTYFLYVELRSKRRDSYYDHGVKEVLEFTV